MRGSWTAWNFGSKIVHIRLAKVLPSTASGFLVIKAFHYKGRKLLLLSSFSSSYKLLWPLTSNRCHKTNQTRPSSCCRRVLLVKLLSAETKLLQLMFISVSRCETVTSLKRNQLLQNVRQELCIPDKRTPNCHSLNCRGSNFCLGTERSKKKLQYFLVGKRSSEFFFCPHLYVINYPANFLITFFFLRPLCVWAQKQRLRPIKRKRLFSCRWIDVAVDAFIKLRRLQAWIWSIKRSHYGNSAISLLLCVRLHLFLWHAVASQSWSETKKQKGGMSYKEAPISTQNVPD